MIIKKVNTMSDSTVRSDGGSCSKDDVLGSLCTHLIANLSIEFDLWLTMCGHH